MIRDIVNKKRHKMKSMSDLCHLLSLYHDIKDIHYGKCKSKIPSLFRQ